MRQVALTEVEGSRWVPDHPTGVGALVLAGSSGRVDSERAEVLAAEGVLAESVRWFGGVGQHDAPWEVALELFLDRVDVLASECDRTIVVGTSFGAEAALLTGALHPRVNDVVAFAASDVVWAARHPDGHLTSHWTHDGAPLPFVPFDEDWTAATDLPAYLGLYESSRHHFADRLTAAAIPVEKIQNVVLVAGGDDQVWPSVTMTQAIERRRHAHHLDTVVVVDPDAGHRTILPGEPVVTGGLRMRRGGTEEADRRLGTAAWAQISAIL
jgi:pimeloyl-ACP methyl ester carboxylesterase